MGGRGLGLRMAVALTALVAAGACQEAATPTGQDSAAELECSIPQSEILPGGPGKDGIPALTDPPMATPDAPGAAYLSDDARVIGFEVDGSWYAIPLNIMWWHEIVNVNLGDTQLAVTHCPLTGSTLAFHRGPVGGGEFGVSGLLYLNNLVMYDRTSEESFWPQMLRGARCGPRDGTQLPMYPVVETRWERWTWLHPDTRVVSDETSYDRDYNRYPYGDYAELNNSSTLFPMPSMDSRRPPKERVLAIPVEEGGVAYPFGVLDQAGRSAVIEDRVNGRDIVVLWSREGQGAMAFEPVLDGQPVSLQVVNDTIKDLATGTVWTEDGRAVRGPRAGAQLPAVNEAFVAYWFAWAGFYPETEIWAAS